MKFAIDGLGLQSGSAGRGIGRYLQNLIGALAKSSSQPFVVYLSQNLPQDRLPQHPNIRPRVLPGNYTKAVADIVAGNPDKLDWLVIGSPFETHAGFLIPEQNQSVIPLASIAYDLIPLLFPDEYLTGDRYAPLYHQCVSRLRSYRRFLSISESTADDFRALLDLPPEIVQTIGAATDNRFFVTGQASGPWPAGVNPNHPFVLYLGQSEARKNCYGMLEAYAALPHELRYVSQLVMVCPLAPPHDKKIPERVRALGISGNVVLLSRVGDQELRTLYRGCAAFCFPSHYEGFGLPLLEAMLCGAPCIAGNNSSQIELAGDAAILVDTKNTQAITQALSRVLSDNTHAADLRTRAIEQAKLFSWDVVARSFLETMDLPVIEWDPGIEEDVPLPPQPEVLPNHFPEAQWMPAPADAESYWARVARGQQVAGKARVVFCGLMRDVHMKLPRVKAFIGSAGALFADWRAVWYENDSRDQTGHEIASWGRQDARVIPISVRRGHNRWQQVRSPDRGTRMAEYRNTYHVRILNDFSDYDYVIVLDTDLAGWSLQGLLSTFGTTGWDMAGSNGLHRLRGRWTQYDAWAWRDIGHPDAHSYKEINRRVFGRGQPMVPVMSCFGGMAIYRMDAFLASRYGGGDCEHVLLHKGMAGAGYDRIFCNPGMITLYDD